MAIFQQGMFLFDPKNDTPETVARKRAIVAQIMGSGRAPQTIGEGLNAIGDGIVANVLNRRADEATKAGQESAAAAWNPFVSALGPQQFPDAPGASVGGSSVDPASQRVAQAFGDSALPSSFLAAVDQHEGAGGYDTLFGHAQRGQFAGTDVSKMTVGQAMAFADPSGPYAQSVKAKIGRVATPMGRHQIVGKTLRTAAQEMGLDPSTPFNQQTQDAIAAHLARRRIASAGTMEGKVNALRSEWAGLKSVPYSRMVQIVTDLENGGTGSPQAAPVQVASLDPSAGVGASAVPPEYANTGLSQAAWDRMNAPDGGMPSPGPANIPIASGKGGRVSMAQAAPVQMQPGPIPNPGPEQSAFLGRMTDPQPMGGAPMPMQGMPAPQAAPQPQQVAQAQPAGPDLASVPVTAGGNAGQYQAGQGPSLQMLMQAAANPWLNDSQKAVINMMLKQQLDPNAGLDRRYREAQIRNIESEIAKRDDPNARDNFGNSVIWGQNENGDWVAMQPSSGGGLVPAQTPEGIKLSPPGISDLNLGTRYATRDRNGNIISEADIDNSGKAADTATGKAQGEAAASYRSMASKLPGLEKVVSDLGKLADEATYTKAGQWVDWFRKEAGAEPRPEAIARTKYIAMVDNQILPLLRDTFGAQFTVQEGESLRATLGDPNKTPAEKKEVLRAFIEQKKRDVAALAVQGGVETAPQPQQTGKRLRFNPETGELE